MITHSIPRFVEGFSWGILDHRHLILGPSGARIPIPLLITPLGRSAKKLFQIARHDQLSPMRNGHLKSNRVAVSQITAARRTKLPGLGSDSRHSKSTFSFRCRPADS